MLENTNEVINGVFVASGIFLILLLFCFVIIYNYVKIKVGREREILSAVFNTAESERNRIADDLHDSLGSNIAVLKMYNESLMHQLDHSGTESILQKNALIIDKAIAEIRLICRNQSGKFIVDNGIVHELEYLQHSVSGLIILNVKNTGNIPQHLSPDFKIHLFRIIQELLQNAIKHSKCKMVTIGFSATSNQFNMFFKDDGIGMPFDLTRDRSGMKNITGRVKIFDGKHNISVNGNKGTQHSFTFLLNRISNIPGN